MRTVPTSSEISGWSRFVDQVRDVVVGKQIGLSVRGSALTLFSDNPSVFQPASDSTDDEGWVGDVAITMQDLGDELVQITTGWFTTVVVDYRLEVGDHHQPSTAIQVLQAILDGSAQETVHLDSSGALVGISWRIRGPHLEQLGRRGVKGLVSHTRGLPAW